MPAIACAHGVRGAWLTPSLCCDCRALIDASRVAAQSRARAAFEAQFVREVREELRRREQMSRSRPARGAPFDGHAN